MLKDKIVKIAEEKIDELDAFLVGISITTNNNITIYIDSFKAITLDHCVLVSKYIEDRFDRDIEDYSLTVCSAGLDTPFKVNDQYKKNIGKEVNVLLIDGKRCKGKILDYGETLDLEVKKKKGRKKYSFEEVCIPINKIKETKLNINFK
jgi:ribosome maturation factor RimP